MINLLAGLVSLAVGVYLIVSWRGESPGFVALGALNLFLAAINFAFFVGSLL